jgi:hypothetical protein
VENYDLMSDMPMPTKRPSELGEEEEMGEEEEGMGENPLASFSDEELMSEVKARGLV